MPLPANAPRQPNEVYFHELIDTCANSGQHREVMGHCIMEKFETRNTEKGFVLSKLNAEVAITEWVSPRDRNTAYELLEINQLENAHRRAIISNGFNPDQQQPCGCTHLATIMDGGCSACNYEGHHSPNPSEERTCT